MSSGTWRIGPGKSVMGVVLALVLVGLLLAVAACEDATPATSTSVAAVAETPTTEAAPVTTEQPTATTVTETTAATETTTASEGAVINVDNGDNGREVVLQVGDRLRIDLAPKAVDRVQAVEWDYEPIVVQQTDSGEDKADDVVVGAWLEVEAMVAGPVTIRASYEYPQGTVKTTFTVYVRVVGTATTVASGEAPALSLDEGDNGREVALKVGERLRVDLTPKVTDRVEAVRWNYPQVVVQEKDSGANTISDVVVGAWLEVEAVAAGPVTIRTQYEYPGGTVTTPWIIFVTVTD